MASWLSVAMMRNGVFGSMQVMASRMAASSARSGVWRLIGWLSSGMWAVVSVAE